MSIKNGEFKGAKIIRADSGDAQQWTPPDVGGRSVQEQAGGGPLLRAAELEELAAKAHQEGLDQGRKEGFEFGHREGLEAGRQEILERIAQFDSLLQGLAEPFAELDDQVEQEIVTLVVAMVRQLVRREVKTDPAQIVGVVREALNILPVNARRIRVLLHPEDAQLVRDAYTLGDSDQKWQIVEDPVIQRGGCQIYTENSHVDATLESRISALIAPLLGSEREGGHAAEHAAK
jgi:flagellar assembly protein FliH